MKRFLTKFTVCAAPALLVFQLAGARLAKAQDDIEPSREQICRQIGYDLLEEGKNFMSRKSHELPEAKRAEYERLIREAPALIEEHCAEHPRMASFRFEKMRSELKMKSTMN